MYRVKLDYKLDPHIMYSKDKIENIYNQLDGKVVYSGAGNGVYHILNARKDNIKVITAADNLEALKTKGYIIEEQEFRENNVVVAPAPLGRLYTVKPADTLDSISNEYGIEKNMLIKINNLKTEKLFIGQKLHIE